MNVDDVILALDVFGIDVRVNVAARAVRIRKRIDSVLDRLAPDGLALLQREIADQLLFREDRVAIGRDRAEGVHRAFFDRNDDLHALPLARADVDDLRLTERYVRVAVVHVVVLDVLQVFVQLRRDVEIFLSDPRDDVRRLHFLHLMAQLAAGKMCVAGEVDRGDAGFAAFIDVEDDFLFARLEHAFGRRIDAHAFESTFGVCPFDRFRRPLHERLLDGVADVEIDLLLLQRLVDLRVVQLFVAAVFDRANAWPFLDDCPDDDAAVSAFGLNADVIEESGLPKVQKVFLNLVGVVRLAGSDAEINANGVAGDGGVPAGFESLHGLSSEVARGGWLDGSRGGRRHCGLSDPAGFRTRDDRTRLRFRRLLRIGLRRGGSGDQGREGNGQQSCHRNGGKLLRLDVPAIEKVTRQNTVKGLCILA